MTPNFSDDIKKLINKKPLDKEDIRPLKTALRKYAEDYLDLKVGGNSSINLTDTFTNDIKVADANDNFFRDIGRQMERTRDYTMYENKKQDGSKEIVVIPLDRPILEKHAILFTVGGIFLGAILSVLGGFLQNLWQSHQDIPKKIEVKATNSGDSVSTIYRIEVMDSAKH